MRMFIKFLIPCLIFLLASPASYADDIDAFRQQVKSNAMIVMDTSGSMAWPVYDSNIDYAAFMKWLLDQGLATDDGECRGDSSWWGTTYDKLDPKAIYLVQSNVGHRLITYVDSNNATQVSSATGDVMWKTDETNNYVDDWLKTSIIPCKNADNELWTLNSNSSIDVEVANDVEYVVFPKGTLAEIAGSSVSVPTDIKGKRLFNAQDIELSKIQVDPQTNQATDVGFLGFLKTAGFYFSGTFEGTTSGLNFINSSNSNTYFFASGNWLNFLKLVEDFKVSTAYAGCKKNWTYGYQKDMAWKYFCYKPAGTEPPWTVVTLPQPLMSYDTDYTGKDYPDTVLREQRGVISGNAFTKQIKIKFDYIDTDYKTGEGTNNDYVEFIDADTNVSLLALSGQEIKPNSSGSDASVSYDGGVTWTSISKPLDMDGYTIALNAKSVKVIWNNGSIKQQSGTDQGFKILGYKYTDQLAGTPGDFTCCNTPDGYGYKIKSRMDIAKKAMVNAVEMTKENVNWGLLRFNSGTGGTVLAPLGTSPASVVSLLEDLEPTGSTPLGEALQDAYKSNYSYLEANPSVALCSPNFMLAMTDGFPTDDGDWNRINIDGSPSFGKCTSGYGGCAGTYGDKDVWPDNGGTLNNYMDDVAHWLHHKAKYKHTTHSIAFGLNNPMLGDVADSSGGIYLTAYDEEQLMNAFYSLGLSMSNSVAFTAPAVSVDEENRVQSGNELYMAFFRPDRNTYWQGNFKKYEIEWNSTAERIIDSFGNPVTESDGSFKATSRSFWSTENDGGVVNKGGAGGVLLNKVKANFSSNNFYNRNIKTYKGNATIPFNKGNVLFSDLAVTNSTVAAKAINFVYGYTYDEDGSTNPVAVRDWVLGDIIHSEPMVLDYVDTSLKRELTNRYLAVGANDGLLHVFDSETGQEVYGFVPPDVWGNLKKFSNNKDHFYSVDGQISKYQTGRNPKYLVFGLRMGGRSYYALDVSNSTPSTWNVAWSITNSGDFSELGQSWSKMYFTSMALNSTASKDVGIFTGGYDESEETNATSFLSGGNIRGRGIYVVDAQNGNLVFKCTYGATNSTVGNAYTRSDMKYCFPGDPRVINLTKYHPDGDIAIYAVDIAGQLWKILYNYAASPQWTVTRLFNSNGITNVEGGVNVLSGGVGKLTGTYDGGTLVASDGGRKVIGQPVVSYAGDCSTDRPVVYFGTGDRQHPNDSTVHHRFYAIYDMSSNATYPILTERDLLNVTCDELDTNSTASVVDKANIKAKLGDNYTTNAQGWFIKLDAQGSCIGDPYNHAGEKLVSSPRLFNSVLYFSTYRPTLADPCNPNGDSLLYALKYCYGTSAYEYFDTMAGNKISDRYIRIEDGGLASSWTLIEREGVGAAKISVGSKLLNIPIDAKKSLEMIWWDYD